LAMVSNTVYQFNIKISLFSLNFKLNCVRIILQRFNLDNFKNNPNK
jgi:hypothetical protein